MKALFSTLSLLLILSSFASAQVKPSFKKLTYVSYETDALKQNATIRGLLVIDANGKVNFKIFYYNGVADTIYKLTITEVEKLNNIFNGEKKLKDFVVRTKMPGTMRYAGSFKYITYVANNGETDELTIVPPFMEDEFNNTLVNISKRPKKVNPKVKQIKDLSLEKQILICEKATPYLPKIELPPSEVIMN